MDPETKRMAAEAVGIAQAMGKTLDYSEQSVAVVEEVLELLGPHLREVDDAARHLTAERFGCYLLAVGQRTYGGRTAWNEQRGEPVLVVGEPACRVAVMTWGKVLGWLRGDRAEGLAVFWEGFAVHARKKVAGSDLLVL